VPEGSERTAEEREQARLERERRRAEQAEGAGVPPPAAEAGIDGSADGHEDHEDAEEDGYELASGTRRVGWRERSAGGAANAARGGPPRSGRAAGRGRRRSLVSRLIALLALALAAVAVWFCVELLQPFHGSGHGSVVVTIPPHSGASEVGALLERDGVISSKSFFELRATISGDRGKLRAGTYHLRLGMSYGQVLHVLTTPPPAAPTTELTVIPGETRAHVDTLLRQQGVRGSYKLDTLRSPLLNPSWYGAPRDRPSLEGFLFPDTYQLITPVSIPVLVADQLKAFRQQFATVNLGYARAHPLTPYDVLIVASLVQAEAATLHDFPLVASTVYNRLRINMPLELDSTTRYATGNYSRPLTVSELRSPSPWNTHTHYGLPPTPIDSPGLAAINAAAHPARTGYLYFVSKPCRSGALAFSTNYKQFLADVHNLDSARTVHGAYTARC
jgi:UPF0755 protein